MDFLQRITVGKQARPMRNVVYGTEGIGKSEFAARFPAPLFIAAEDGTSAIDTSRIVPTDWNDLINILAQLHGNPDHTFKTINIDTAGWAEEMAAKQVCVENNVQSLEDIGYGKWKRMLVDKFENLLRWLAALYGQGMHINVIAHSQAVKFSNPEGEDYDRYNVLMTSKDLAERLKQWADNVLFMNFDTMIEENKNQMKAAKAKSFNRRLMHTERSAAYDAKNRMALPKMIEIGPDPETGFANFMQHYDAWIASIGSTPAAADAAQPTPAAE